MRAEYVKGQPKAKVQLGEVDSNSGEISANASNRRQAAWARGSATKTGRFDHWPKRPVYLSCMRADQARHVAARELSEQNLVVALFLVAAFAAVGERFIIRLFLVTTVTTIGQQGFVVALFFVAAVAAVDESFIVRLFLVAAVTAIGQQGFVVALFFVAAVAAVDESFIVRLFLVTAVTAIGQQGFVVALFFVAAVATVGNGCASDHSKCTDRQRHAGTRASNDQAKNPMGLLHNQTTP
ncbi:MAG: hypothetical protein KDA44_03725 [Planctomycetales bacterium]|nr:hypothetical protein [Planctomycetales bacterium]